MNFIFFYENLKIKKKFDFENFLRKKIVEKYRLYYKFYSLNEIKYRILRDYFFQN